MFFQSKAWFRGALGLFLCASLRLEAAQVIWGNSGTDFNAPVSWSGGVAPGPNDTATFIGPAPTNLQPVVTSNTTLTALNFSLASSTGYSLTSTNGATLTLSSNGTGTAAAINSANSVAQTSATTQWDNVIAVPLILTAAAPNIRSTSTDNSHYGAITLNGPISSPGAIQLKLEGRVNLNGANTYSGTTVLPLFCGVGNRLAFGTSTLTVAGTSHLTVTTDLTGPNRLSNPITFSGALTTDYGSLPIELAGNINGSSATLSCESTAGMIVSGAISASYATLEAGFGVLTVTGTNTFPFVTIAGGSGKVSVPAIGAIGVPGPLGKGSIITFNYGTLLYTGPGETTNRSISPSGTCAIESSGTGPLILTASMPGPSNGGSFTLSGSNSDANTFAGVIGQPTNLTKDGTGVWVLTGANTYSGDTRVYAGTLKISGSGLLGSGNLYMIGTLDVSDNLSMAGTLDVTTTNQILGGNLTMYAGSVVGTGGGTLRAAAYNITGGGDIAVSLVGAGNLTKTNSTFGTTATLSGANTYSGTTTVTTGTLVAAHDGALGTGATTIQGAGTLSLAGITVNNPIAVNGQLAGTGTASGAVTLNNTGSLAPGNGGIGTLNLGSLLWNGGGTFALKLASDGGSDRVAIAGSLTKGTGSGFNFDFQGTGTANRTYVLATFGSLSGFTAGDVSPFYFRNLPVGMTGTFSLTSTSLYFTVAGLPGSAPVITMQPVDQAVRENTQVSFTAWASANPAPTYRWQAAVGTPVFYDIGELTGSTGYATPTLTWPAQRVGAGMNGWQFRCVVSNGVSPDAISAVATLTVNTPPGMPSSDRTTFTVGVPRSFTFTASGRPAPTFTVTGGVLPAWASLNSTTGVLSGTPPNTTGSPFVFTITAANGLSPDATQSFTLTVTGAPELDVFGNSIAIASGDTTPAVADGTDFDAVVVAGTGIKHSFVLKNTGTAALTLTGSPLVAISGTNAGEFTVTQPAGATIAANAQATFDVNFMPQASGLRTATVSIASDDANENPYTFALRGTGVMASATHVFMGAGYVPGGTVTIKNTFAFPVSATMLKWQVTLPAGISFAADGGSGAQVKPSAGATSLLEWTWTTLPANPVTFTYTLNVPSNFTTSFTLDALGVMSLGGGPNQSALVRFAPLEVSFAGIHSADTSRNQRIDLVELTRIIELYNTRNGTVRTGSYAVAAATTEDGFVTAPTRATGTSVTLARYHLADSDRNGTIDLAELTRVISLYNYRAGNLRTGQYHVQAGTEDGFAPGP